MENNIGNSLNELPMLWKGELTMTTLEEKVTAIIELSDFNDLPYEDRKRIGKYMAEQQILTIWQMMRKDQELTTEAWRKKQRSWLKSCVESYRRDFNDRP